MKYSIFLLFALLMNLQTFAQRRNIFHTSEQKPNCSIIKKGTFYENNYSSESQSTSTLKVLRTVIIRRNKMKIIWKNNQIIIFNKIKYLSKCKFESEIFNIKTKLLNVGDYHIVGDKTTYEIVETGKDYVILDYWCNNGRNICTLILDNKR